MNMIWVLVLIVKKIGDCKIEPTNHHSFEVFEVMAKSVVDQKSWQLFSLEHHGQ